REVRHHIPEVRDAPDCPLVSELMVRLVLSNGRREDQERQSRQAAHDRPDSHQRGATRWTFAASPALARTVTGTPSFPTSFRSSGSNQEFGSTSSHANNLYSPGVTVAISKRPY